NSTPKPELAPVTTPARRRCGVASMVVSVVSVLVALTPGAGDDRGSRSGSVDPLVQRGIPPDPAPGFPRSVYAAVTTQRPGAPRRGRSGRAPTSAERALEGGE